MIRIRIERRTVPESKLSWSEIREISADILLVIFGVWVLGSFSTILDWWLARNWGTFKANSGSGNDNGSRHHCYGHRQMACPPES